MSYKQFFIVLPSNTPGEGNTTNRYRCQLPKRLEFNGTWQVGLHSISFPHSWPSLGAHKQQYIDIYLLTGGHVRINVPKGTYLTPQDLASSINSAIQSESLATTKLIEVTRENQSIYPAAPGVGHYVISDYEDAVVYHRVTPQVDESFAQAVQRTASSASSHYTLAGEGDYKSVSLQYLESHSRFQVTFNPSVIKHVAMSEQLYYVLGFPLAQKIRSLEMATYPPDMHGGISSIGVYTNIVEPMIVGDSMASLLRYVAVTGKPGQNIEKIYEAPIYSKVVDREISSLLIDLRTLDGRPVLFTSGNVICTLVFRKVALV